jgi:hypothetical protein
VLTIIAELARVTPKDILHDQTGMETLKARQQAHIEIMF